MRTTTWMAGLVLVAAVSGCESAPADDGLFNDESTVGPDGKADGRTPPLAMPKTVIDWERFGDERVFAFIDVKVTPARGVGFDDVAERIYRYPEVHSVFLVSGTQDLRCVVEGRTIREIADFVAQNSPPSTG